MAENDKNIAMQRFYTFSVATVKHVSKTIIPRNMKFLHTDCISRPHLTTTVQ